MKRFYKQVTVAEVEGGHVVHLDGKPVRTPAKAPFILNNRALMEAVAEEWDAQVEDIRPHSMPVTQLAAHAIDRIPAQRAEIVRAVAAYAETDLLCSRPDHPVELAERQILAERPLVAVEE